MREGFSENDASTLAALRTRIELFIAHWPDDGLTPLAHVYLALVTLAQGDLATADRELALCERLPPGTTRDLWTVASAKRLRLGGNAEGAVLLLRPLVGKTVEPIMRSIFQEELALAALATHRDYEAISYMDAWLRAANEENPEQTRRTVAGLVEKLPKDVLLASLEAMRAQRASFGYGAEIERILSRRLVQIATTSGDAELARTLLDADAGALVVRGEAGAELGELASSRRGMNVVEGRTLGLLLPTELPALRDESADVLRGIMWALGLPKGVRGGGEASPARADAGGAQHAACARLEAAPPLDEPGAGEAIHLVTRDDAVSRVRPGVPPETLPPGADFAFILGEARARVVEELARAVPALAQSAVVPVVDASEVTILPAQGGRVGALAMLPPVSCDIPAVRAGDPRFPLAQWDRDHVRNWLVTGSPGCASDVLGELSASHARGVVALTLEAAALPAHGAGVRVVSASAGVVPTAAAGDVRDDELRRFTERLGPVGWWTALGRDAATLARVAMRGLPLGTAADAKEVESRRIRARDLLAGARARLWSTEAAGWQAGHVLARTVCSVDALAR